MSTPVLWWKLPLLTLSPTTTTTKSATWTTTTRSQKTHNETRKIHSELNLVTTAAIVKVAITFPVAEEVVRRRCRQIATLSPT